MNIPNLLTLLRIVLVPIVVILLIQGSFPKAMIAFVAAALTDALDGFLARTLGQQTAFGAYLDPIADKALLASAFVTLSVLSAIPGWLTVIVISRDIVILLGILVFFLMSAEVKIRPTTVSKITTAVQLVTVLAVLSDRSFPGYIHELWLTGLFFIAAFVTVVSGLDYMKKGQKLIDQASGK
jgi:cardiolipin synthase